VKPELIVKSLGLQPYQTIWQAMQDFTAARTDTTPDELWLLEHEPVFTLGQAGKHEHVLDAHGIPLIQTDRGGQVTYHGPGQLMAYCLFDLNRAQLNSRQLVIALEQAIIHVLSRYGIIATGSRDAPGVYVGDAKIASLGLRISKGFSYHGLAINVHNDLAPFSYINPCGIVGQAVTSLKALGHDVSVAEIGQQLSEEIKKII
jgi:lipoyl(octanoyl) transferase